MPPKKATVKPSAKVDAANVRKAEVQKVKDAEKAKLTEAETAAEWSVGANSRGGAREAAAAEKQMDKLRKDREKADAEAAEEEMVSGVVVVKKKPAKKKDDVSALLMAGLPKKKAVKKGPALTAPSEQNAMRQAQQDAERKVMSKKGIVMVADDDLFVANDNHALMDEDESATGLENAISMLKTGEAQPAESKNMRVLYAAFQDKTMPALREEHPGLKLSQYKEKCFALWQKHPDHPNNRVGAQVAKPEATTAL